MRPSASGLVLEARPVARVIRRNRCGRTATGHSDSGREQRLAARLARVNQRKRWRSRFDRDGLNLGAPQIARVRLRKPVRRWSDLERDFQKKIRIEAVHGILELWCLACNIPNKRVPLS
jgi:hypothetical protein